MGIAHGVFSVARGDIWKGVELGLLSQDAVQACARQTAAHLHKAHPAVIGGWGLHLVTR